MAHETILIVEDEKDLIKPIQYSFEREGYKVVAALDGEKGLYAFKKEKPDLVLLDIMLPKLDGFEFCRIVRRASSTPIIMLTARKEELDRVLGLELGADDYVVKPFSVRELLARVKAIFRRSKNPTDREFVVRLGRVEVDLQRYDVRVNGEPVILSSKEFIFLKYLIEAKGKVMTREKLLEKVWGIENSLEIDTRTIDQHISRLREKIKPESKRIVTVKNVGYRIKID